MRILFTFLTLALTAFGVNAQQISGIAKDADGKPLSGATITLLKETAVVKLALSKTDGAYSFSDIKEGTYTVMASHVGHAPTQSAPFTV